MLLVFILALASVLAPVVSALPQAQQQTGGSQSSSTPDSTLATPCPNLPNTQDVDGWSSLVVPQVATLQVRVVSSMASFSVEIDGLPLTYTCLPPLVPRFTSTPLRKSIVTTPRE